MSIIVLLTAADWKKPKRQQVPESWLRQPVSKLLAHVAPTLLGPNCEAHRLRCRTADDGSPISASAPINTAMTNGATYFIYHESLPAALNVEMFGGGAAPVAPPAPDKEPAPELSTRMAYAPVKSVLKSGTTQLDVLITTPTGGTDRGSLEKDDSGSGGATAFYTPAQPGEHTMQLSFQGVAIGGARKFTVAPGVECALEWADVSQAEQLAM